MQTPFSRDVLTKKYCSGLRKHLPPQKDLSERSGQLVKTLDIQEALILHVQC